MCIGPDTDLMMCEPCTELSALTEKLRIVEAERDEMKRKYATQCAGSMSAHGRRIHLEADLSALRAELERKEAALKEARLACVVRAQIAEEAISAGYAHGSGNETMKKRAAYSLEKCRRDLNAALQPTEPPCQTA